MKTNKTGNIKKLRKKKSQDPQWLKNIKQDSIEKTKPISSDNKYESQWLTKYTSLGLWNLIIRR